MIEQKIRKELISAKQTVNEIDEKLSSSEVDAEEIILLSKKEAN